MYSSTARLVCCSNTCGLMFAGLKAVSSVTDGTAGYRFMRRGAVHLHHFSHWCQAEILYWRMPGRILPVCLHHTCHNKVFHKVGVNHRQGKLPVVRQIEEGLQAVVLSLQHSGPATPRMVMNVECILQFMFAFCTPTKRLTFCPVTVTPDGAEILMSPNRAKRLQAIE